MFNLAAPSLGLQLGRACQWAGSLDLATGLPLAAPFGGPLASSEILTQKQYLGIVVTAAPGLPGRVLIAKSGWFTAPDGFPVTSRPGLIIATETGILEVRQVVNWNDVVIGVWAGTTVCRLFLFPEPAFGAPGQLDVAWFGAIPADSATHPNTDCIDAFEAAIAASGVLDPGALEGWTAISRRDIQNRCGTIQVGPGRYRLSRPLSLWRPCQLRGAGKDVTHLRFDSRQGITIPGTPGTTNEWAMESNTPLRLDSSDASDAMISSLTIEGQWKPSAPYVPGTAAGVLMNSRARLDHVHVTQFRKGIHIWGTGEAKPIPGWTGGEPAIVRFQVRPKAGTVAGSPLIAAAQIALFQGAQEIGDKDSNGASSVMWLSASRPGLFDRVTGRAAKVNFAFETRCIRGGAIVGNVIAADGPVADLLIEYKLTITPRPGVRFDRADLLLGTPGHTLFEPGSLTVNDRPVLETIPNEETVSRDIVFEVDYNYFDASNCNRWQLAHVDASNCEIGLHVHGGDSNAGLCLDYFGNGEMRWALVDSSYLGSNYISTFLEGEPNSKNGETAGSILTDGGSNRSVFLGTYIEGALVPPRFDSQALLLGGVVSPSVAPGQAFPILSRGVPLPDFSVRSNDNVFGGMEVGLGRRSETMDGGSQSGIRLQPGGTASSDVDAALYYFSGPSGSYFGFKTGNSTTDAFRVSGRFHPYGPGKLLLSPGASIGTDPNRSVRQFVVNNSPAELEQTMYRQGDIVWLADVRPEGINGWRCMKPGIYADLSWVSAQNLKTFIGELAVGTVLIDGLMAFQCQRIAVEGKSDLASAQVSPGGLAGFVQGRSTILSIDSFPLITISWTPSAHVWLLEGPLDIGDGFRPF